ncbi:MAG: PAS domain-containing protein, partial [Spirochaetota bacterium]
RLFGLPSELLAAFAAEQGAGRPVPLCILDMRMPEQSGLDVALALRAIDPEVTIVICTAYSDATAANLKNQLRTGVFLVQKPFAADEFRLLVHSLLREWEGRKTLRGNEERLRHIIEATNVGTWEWNIPTGETVFNERWAEIVGYTLAELEPVSIATWEALAHPEDGPRSEEMLKRHFSGELPYYDIECRMRHKDGHWVWVQDRGQVVTRDRSGAPLHMSGTHTDISDRKTADAKRRELEQRLAWALEAADEGIWDWDIKSNKVTHNARWCGLLGMDETFLEHPISVFSSSIHEEDRQRVMDAIEACMEGKEPYESSHRMVRRDGSIVWVLDRGKIVSRDEEGRPSRMVGSMADITERKRAEAELLEIKSRELRDYADELSEKVEERTRALEQTKDALVRQERMASIGRLASGVAHEINNPIGYIQANLTAMTEYVESFRAVIRAGEVLAKAVSSGDSEGIAAAATDLEQAREKAEIDYLMEDIGLLVADSRKGAIRIGEIVLGLRSFARDDGGSIGPCDVNAIVGASLRMVESKLKYNCVVDRDFGDLAPVLGTPGQLEPGFV